MLAVAAHADDRAPLAVDPLVQVAAGDPLELGRFVQNHGDAYVLARLDATLPTDTRLAAVTATPWLAEPEQALEPLTKMASGSDPHLAPGAAWAAHRIAADLDPFSLARREVLLSSLSAPIRRLRALAQDDSARRDVRRVAAFAADALARLGPDGEGGQKGGS